MKTNFNLLFYMKKQKNYQNGAAPVYLRITVAGKRAEITTGRECEPERWNSKAGGISGSKEDAKSLNAYLDNLQSMVYDAHKALTEDKLAVTFTYESLVNFSGISTLLGYRPNCLAL